MIEWNAEKISALDTDKVKSLRDNAVRLSQNETIGPCDAELQRRKPSKSLKPVVVKENRSGHYVAEFDFVCPHELGVTTNPDGTKWTGTWVVDEVHARAAERYGSIVALHTSKAELSYLQGTVKSWRKSPREPRYSGDQTVKTESGPPEQAHSHSIVPGGLLVTS